MKKETKRIKEYRAEKIKEKSAYNFSVLINDKELAEFAKNITNKSEFLKNAIREQLKK
jgi:hypothetical protein